MRYQKPQSEARRDYRLQSLTRGLEVLKCFTPSTPLLSLKDISAKLGIPKGSTYRLVATLEHLGYLRQDPDTKRYQLGIRVLDLGFSCLAGMGAPTVALPYLERLAKDTQESASMAVLDDLEIVYVARASINRVMSINLSLGSRLPAYCTSMGKVLLAHLEEKEQNQLLPRIILRKETPNTISDEHTFREHLAITRSRGYAINDQELELGLRSAASPVRDASGRVVAAINVSVAAARITMEALERDVVPRVLECARDISEALGYRGRGIGVVVSK